MTQSAGRQALQVPSKRALSPVQRKTELDKGCSAFVAPGAANRQLYTIILERLLPPDSGIPGPVVTRQEIRDAINAVKPGYKDVFRRVRELQGEEGLTGIIKLGSKYQLVSLATSAKREPRKVLGGKLALEVALRQGGRCAVCGIPIGAEGPTRAELDHRVPRIRRGDNSDANLQGLCSACNNAKSTQCTNCTLDCGTCGWAFPEQYRPVKLRPDIILRLNARAKESNQDVDQLANAVLDKELRD